MVRSQLKERDVDRASDFRRQVYGSIDDKHRQVSVASDDLDDVREMVGHLLVIPEPHVPRNGEAVDVWCVFDQVFDVIQCGRG